MKKIIIFNKKILFLNVNKYKMNTEKSKSGINYDYSLKSGFNKYYIVRLYKKNGYKINTRGPFDRSKAMVLFSKIK